VTLARYRRLREPKVNGGRNASPGARGCRPQLRARRFLVPTSRERNARYIAAVRRSRSCVSHRVFSIDHHAAGGARGRHVGALVGLLFMNPLAGMVDSLLQMLERPSPANKPIAQASP
jgi:hypothetical protein